LFGGFIIWQASALWWYITRTKVRTKNLRIENRGIKLALQPMLLAERDRGYIKQLKLNRDAEEDLMKDVEGWEVGTWFGEPIYKTVRDEL
jgi:NADH dehydrogenase (ubiquinone) 1 alpha subcomplex subunit 13